MTERISNEDWDLIKGHNIHLYYELYKTYGMELDIEWMEGMLDKFWELGTIEEIDSKLLSHFTNLVKVHNKDTTS